MKVTIITNGDTKLVLKPETQQEILAVKTLNEKPLFAELLETTQILKESYPNCLVIKEGKQTETKETVEEQRPMIAVMCISDDSRLLGIIPKATEEKDILSFIREQAGVEEVYKIKENLNILMNTDFNVGFQASENHIEHTYRICLVDIYKKW